jgi:hypothetical protein
MTKSTLRNPLRENTSTAPAPDSLRFLFCRYLKMWKTQKHAEQLHHFPAAFTLLVALTLVRFCFDALSFFDTIEIQFSGERNRRR